MYGLTHTHTFTYSGDLMGIQWYPEHRFELQVTFNIDVCYPMRAFSNAIVQFDPSAVMFKDYMHARRLHLLLNLQLNSI